MVKQEQIDLSVIYKNKPFDLPAYINKRKSQINNDSPND